MYNNVNFTNTLNFFYIMIYLAIYKGPGPILIHRIPQVELLAVVRKKYPTHDGIRDFTRSGPSKSVTSTNHIPA